jgi:uncharacterized membrane protein (UPF0127 family)
LPTATITNSAGKKVPVQVEIAQTDAQKEQGLRGRTYLPNDQGMLFPFDQEQPVSMTMEGATLPISVAFINKDKRIVDIQDMQSLDEGPYVYLPACQVRSSGQPGLLQRPGGEGGG